MVQASALGVGAQRFESQWRQCGWFWYGWLMVPNGPSGAWQEEYDWEKTKQMSEITGLLNRGDTIIIKHWTFTFNLYPHADEF